MIIDSSVIVAIGLREAECERFIEELGEAATRSMSAGTWIELSAVAVRGRLLTIDWLDRALGMYQITIEPVTIEQARIGHAAYRQYGIGSGHKAKLNFGDCFSYALAKAMDEPLLFKGDDFTHTDVRRAIDG